MVEECVAGPSKTRNIKPFAWEEKGGFQGDVERCREKEWGSMACSDCPFISWYICMRISSSSPLSIPHPSDIWLTARININKPAHHFREKLPIVREKMEGKKLICFSGSLPMVIAPCVCLPPWQSCKLELCLNRGLQEADSHFQRLEKYLAAFYI